RSSRPPVRKAAPWSRSAHLGRVLRRRAVLGRPLTAPRAPEVADYVEQELQDEEHRTSGKKQARRIERKTDRAHGGLADLPTVGELAEAVPSQEDKEHQRNQMRQHVQKGLHRGREERVQNLDADMAALLLR